MSPQEEAIEVLQKNYPSECFEDLREAVDEAIEALEKRIGKEPIRIKDKYGISTYYLYCPSCKNWIGIWNERLQHGDMYNTSNRRICPYCGQAIDAEDIR